MNGMAFINGEKVIFFLFTLLMLPLIFFVKVYAVEEFSLSETNTYNYVDDYEKIIDTIIYQ